MSNSVTVRCFDSGRSRYQTGELHPHDTGVLLLIVGHNKYLLKLAELRISNQLGDIPRTVNLPDGCILEVSDNDAFRSLLKQSGAKRTGVVFWLEQYWISTAASLCVAVIAIYLFISDGIPLIAKWVAFSLPASVDASISKETVALLDEHWFTPSALSKEEKQALQMRFANLLAHVQLQTAHQPKLLFRSSEKMGANALALPDGTVILLDDLVKAAHNYDQVSAVLAHEVGHVYHRHGLRSVLQASFIALGIAIIDVTSISTIVASLPVFLVQSGYSRDFERQADTFAFRLMTQANIPLRSFADLMQTIDPDSTESPAINLFSTHPPTKERIEQFRAAIKQHNRSNQ